MESASAGKSILFGVGQYVIKAVIICVGIAGGIFIGVFLVKQPGSAQVRNVRVGDNKDHQPLFIAGDPLPPFSVLDEDGETKSIVDQISSRRALVFFTASKCEPCLSMHDFVERTLRRQLSEKTMVITLVDGADSSLVLSAPASSHQEANRYKYDRVGMRSEYNVRIYPTIVGVNENGRIDFLQTGFSTGLIGLPDSYLQEIVDREERR